MKTIMARTPQDSFSFSRRYFHWKKKSQDEEFDDEEVLTNYHSCSSHLQEPEEMSKSEELNVSINSVQEIIKPPKKKFPIVSASSKFMRSAFSFGRNRTSSNLSGLGTKVVGTLFGYRRGHVHFAFQDDPKLTPAFLVELAKPTSVLVKEMASGLVRIALECEKKVEKKGVKLLDEHVWRTYCNGRKCGYAMKRVCGNEEWKVLNSIGPITMGAGVLPGNGEDGVGAEGFIYES
ncbi:hypothetical protein Leryth_015114 [Lithospermum erythrorhizon]|nr:hypothetical protein Leryth_015114 [Lithospermum erythrorhizon]